MTSSNLQGELSLASSSHAGVAVRQPPLVVLFFLAALALHIA
jgi:hypothetical protein